MAGLAPEDQRIVFERHTGVQHVLHPYAFPIFY